MRRCVRKKPEPKPVQEVPSELNSARAVPESPNESVGALTPPDYARFGNPDKQSTRSDKPILYQTTGALVSAATEVFVSKQDQALMLEMPDTEPMSMRTPEPGIQSSQEDTQAATVITSHELVNINISMSDPQRELAYIGPSSPSASDPHHELAPVVPSTQIDRAPSANQLYYELTPVAPSELIEFPASAVGDITRIPSMADSHHELAVVFPSAPLERNRFDDDAYFHPSVSDEHRELTPVVPSTKIDRPVSTNQLYSELAPVDLSDPVIAKEMKSGHNEINVELTVVRPAPLNLRSLDAPNSIYAPATSSLVGDYEELTPITPSRTASSVYPDGIAMNKIMEVQLGSIFRGYRLLASTRLLSDSISLRKAQMVSVYPEAEGFVQLRVYTNLNVYAREVQIMQRLLPHPDIISLMDKFKSQKLGMGVLVTPWPEPETTLAALIDSIAWTDMDVEQIKEALCKAVGYCHSKKIAHLNIQPENLIHVSLPTAQDGGSRQSQWKLIDFSCALMVEQQSSTIAWNSIRLHSYMAPELAKASLKKKNIMGSREMDTWSVGAIVYHLAARRHFLGSETVNAPQPISIKNLSKSNLKIEFGWTGRIHEEFCKATMQIKPEDRVMLRK